MPAVPAIRPRKRRRFAAEYKIKDGPNDQGEMFERPGRPADYFPSPFPNEQAARVANGGALPPDLSLITKARSYERGFPMFMFDFFTQFQEQGPNYVSALLQGFEEKPPAGFTLPEGSYYNKYFPGHAIKMPKPLSDGQVTFDDGVAGDGGAILQGRHHLPDVDRGAAHGSPQAAGDAGVRVPDPAHGAAVFHQEEGLGRRALSAAPQDVNSKSPCGGFFVAAWPRS